MNNRDFIPITALHIGPKNLEEAVKSLVFVPSTNQDSQNKSDSENDEQEKILQKLKDCDPVLFSSSSFRPRTTRAANSQEFARKARIFPSNSNDEVEVGDDSNDNDNNNNNKSNRNLQLLSLGFLTAAGKMEFRQKQQSLITSLRQFDQGLMMMQQQMTETEKEQEEVVQISAPGRRVRN